MSSKTKISIGGKVVTTLPSTMLDGQDVQPTFDQIGRQLTTPYQVRGLTDTAYAQTSTLAEVTLVAGEAGQFHDLVEVTCANTSTVAVTLQLRNSTGGGIVKTFQLPAGDTRQYTFPVPLVQGSASTSWTIQNGGTGDISTTEVFVSAIVIDNV